MVSREGLPKYLSNGCGEKRWMRIVRWRLRNELKESMYWEKDEKRKCRVCEWVEATWEYVGGEYMRGEDERRGWRRNVKKILGEEDVGEKWMKEVEKSRGVKEDERESIGLGYGKHEWVGQGRKGRRKSHRSVRIVRGKKDNKKKL